MKAESSKTMKNRSHNSRLKTHNQRKPLVSVIMPVYNAGAYLAEAIESILNQTYLNFELIIVDDNSTDNSWEIIRSFQTRNPRKIKAVRLAKTLNKGGDSCANEGYKKAQGEFIARMDADDISHPKRLEKQVQYLLTHPQIVVVGSRAHLINRLGKIIDVKNVPTLHPEIYKEYFAVHPMIHPTLMIRRSLLPKRENLYRIKYSANNDYYTFFELLQFGKFANLKEKLLYYRVHDKNDSLTHLKNRFFNTVKIRLEAIVKFGYKPQPVSIFKTFAQMLIVLVLPESLLFHIYFYMRGLKPVKSDLITQLIANANETREGFGKLVYWKVWREKILSAA